MESDPISDGFKTAYVHDPELPIELETARVRNADGSSYEHARLRTGSGGVVVIAISRGRVLFGRSYRVAAGREMFELPRGWLDREDAAAADPSVAAGIRELREETGLHAGRARRVGNYIVDSTVYPQPIAVVECEISSGHARSRADGELRATQWVESRHIRRHINEGLITDGHSLSALAIWKAQRE